MGVCVCMRAVDRMFNWVVKVVPQPPGAEDDNNPPAVRENGLITNLAP